MSDQIISLLIQVPLVGAFIGFAYMLIKMFLASNKEQQQIVMSFIDEQNQRWQEVLEDERARRKEAMDQGLREVEVMAGGIKDLTAAIKQQTEALTRHDESARERYSSLSRALESRAGSDP